MTTKTIFKTLALAMLMPAMLLTTACSSEDDVIKNTEKTETVAQKGFAIPVTVNVTCEGDDATTRATYNDETKKLSFSTGDQLFVSGLDNSAGWFAGKLEWQSGGTFSGTIYTQYEYTGSTNALLAGTEKAALLPAGYEDYGFLDVRYEGYGMLLVTDDTKAFATSKAAGVEQFSLEEVFSYSSGYALKPKNAILSFTINGLKPSTEVNVIFTNTRTNDPLVINKKVTTDGSGTATFAIGVEGGINNLKTISLRVDGKAITLPSDQKLQAGHIYNITRWAVPEGAISGKFTINGNGDKVYFARGNLQATTTDNGASWTWAFATNQWDYVGNAASNTSINGNGTVSTNGTVDLFGWSTNTTYYGIYNSTDYHEYSGDFKDWGATMGSGWRTPSKDEWNYVLKTRSASTINGTSDGRFAKATVAGKVGLIIFPDIYMHPGGVGAPQNVNIDNCDYNGNTYDATAWGKMEDAGCVFLPAAGYREGTSISYVGSRGYYWSSTKNDHLCAYLLLFYPSEVNPEFEFRDDGYSVRLIRAVE